MSKQSILITGSGGFVGKNLYKILKEDFNVFGISKTKNEFVDEVFDLGDEGLVDKSLDNFKPDVIVHLAAFSNVEKCEIEPDLADKNNVWPLKKIVEWSDRENKKLIFVSSDYVFDGIKGDFTEEDTENPIQHYGKTKLAGEKAVSVLKKYVILRPTVIYGWDPDGMNFFMQLYRNQIAGKTMNVPTDQISNPVSVFDLCLLIKKVISTDIFGKFIATGNEKFSRYQFALEICEQMGWNKNLVNPVNTEALKQVAKRPLNNSTHNDLVVKSFNFHFNNLKNNLQIVKNQMKDDLVSSSND